MSLQASWPVRLHFGRIRCIELSGPEEFLREQLAHVSADASGKLDCLSRFLFRHAFAARVADSSGVVRQTPLIPNANLRSEIFREQSDQGPDVVGFRKTTPRKTRNAFRYFSIHC